MHHSEELQGLFCLMDEYEMDLAPSIHESLESYAILRLEDCGVGRRIFAHFMVKW
jgi:hypothetical protein